MIEGMKAVFIGLALAALFGSVSDASPRVEVRDAVSGRAVLGARFEQTGFSTFAVEHPDYWPAETARADGRVWLIPKRIDHAPAFPGFGFPLPVRPLPEAPPVVVPLPMPASLPDSIRVGRRMADTCSGNPVQRIDTIAFEDYVKGVVYAEIGVFQSVAGGPASAAESFKTFAIAARSYALYKYLVDPGAQYHIDDTACNQRYLDQRAAPINAAVDAVRAMVMVKASDHGTIDAFEYAASCGKNGTRPEYQSAIVPDPTTKHGCAGSWCGHDDCAGHEDNPDLPGADKCLVRGICQWGSVERSMAGDGYDSIIDHYQPNLDIVTLPYGGDADGGAPDSGGSDAGTATSSLVGFIREDNIFTGPAIPGASVSLDTGAQTKADDDGYYAFSGLAGGTYTVTATAPGFDTQSDTKTVDTGISLNWKSIALHRLDGGTDASTPDVPAADAGTEDAPPDTSGPDVSSADSATTDVPVLDVNPCGAGTHLEGGLCVLDVQDGGPARDQDPQTDVNGEGGEAGCSCATLRVRD
ncbi:MAG: carboxypeptidase regulatory-like domain-containing protein [Deltaproteobacteria bacterium]|nr:carboxypeptidase regulatory-like domain-containing protein [Deltaproteobacteria bacterium]